MRIFMLTLALAAVLSSAPPVARAADAVPKFDTARNCKAETADTSGIGESLASCVRDEEQARKELADQWDQFAKENKVACIRSTSLDGTPSYVELETCLEMTPDNGARPKGKP